MEYKNLSQEKNTQPFYFKGDDHGVLLIHGFTGSVAHMRPLGELLNQRGFTVKGINLLGHGTMLTQMKGVTWQQWLHQVESEFKALQKECRYVSVGGLSMGGVLTLTLAEKHMPTAIVTYSAPLGVRNPFARWAKFVEKIHPVVKWKTSPKRRIDLPADFDLGYEGFPTRSVYELLSLIESTKKELGKIKTPLLVIQSEDDKTISADSGEEMIAGVSSEIKELHWLKEVPHVITISREYERIASITERFLRSQENKGIPYEAEQKG
ncbi:MAG: alpha/beta fold hydrolase [Clostridiales bacterium]|nr:alpha/beta fold hydrolase [Clostridiales bacterium]